MWLLPQKVVQLKPDQPYRWLLPCDFCLNFLLGDWKNQISTKFGRFLFHFPTRWLKKIKFSPKLVDLNPPVLDDFFTCTGLPQIWNCQFQLILTPGIFTLYCPHSICYGFEVMQTCKLPRHPFQIFTFQLQKPPETIIYDKTCKLHTYCLNREPYLYWDTQFFVDHFHWKGHVGCSEGYFLDAYKSRNVQLLNPQVNEQANSGLRRIKGQIAYMNHYFHCLCVWQTCINVRTLMSSLAI